MRIVKMSWKCVKINSLAWLIRLKGLMQLKSWPADEQFHSRLQIDAVCSNAPIKIDHSGQHIGSEAWVQKPKTEQPTDTKLCFCTLLEEFLISQKPFQLEGPDHQEARTVAMLGMSHTILRKHRGLSRSTSDLTTDCPNKIKMQLMMSGHK